MVLINCIATPRNVSTALMYSFAQRQDTAVVDEPFYACYLDRTGKDHPGRDDILASQPRDYHTVLQNLLSNSSPVLFNKNMAHHMRYLPLDEFANWTNVFLIRDPELLITSFAKVIENPTIRDIGSEDQAMQFKYLNSIGAKTVVVDATELLKDPEGVLRQLCERLEIEFDPAVLSWEAGARDEDGVWARYWYASVHKSTGFKRPSASPPVFPERCRTLLEQARPNYEMLFSHAIKAQANATEV